MKTSSKTKKDGQILFQTVLRAPLNNEELPEGKVPVRIMPYNQTTVSTKDLAKTIAGRCTVKEPDVRAMLTALSQVLKETLLDGNCLKVEGLGTFGLSLTLTDTFADGRKRPAKTVNERIASADVRVGHITFTPCAELRSAMNKAVFVSSGVQADIALERAEVDEFLTSLFGKKDWVTRKEFEAHFHISRNQALRWLKALVGEGALCPVGDRNSRSYIPTPGHYGK